tara:strand:+ start:688 stop:1338 length:651 start_codon:yes stop_codon:yes gene_type:complete
MSSLLAIIQSRTNSKRLKNKALLKIYGLPMIHHVVNNVKKSKKIKMVIVATSKEKSDDKLVQYLKEKEIKYYRGNLNNVALRLANTAKKYKAKYFLRISGDSPLIDYKIINKAIKLLKKSNNIDIITNVYPRSFPKGQSVEIIKSKLLIKNLKKFKPEDKEHVTTYFYKNAKKFRIKNFCIKRKYKLSNLSIDTIKDFKNIKKNVSQKKFYNFEII